MKRLIIALATYVSIATTAAFAESSNRRISGNIIKIECGDATNLSLRLTNRKIVTGACMERWCEALCGDRMATARKRTIGKRISTSVRIINMEESEEGVLANEFYNTHFE
jgi:hypothetical protein